MKRRVRGCQGLMDIGCDYQGEMGELWQGRELNCPDGVDRTNMRASSQSCHRPCEGQSCYLKLEMYKRNKNVAETNPQMKDTREREQW